jgi:hypothetical protein
MKKCLDKRGRVRVVLLIVVGAGVVWSFWGIWWAAAVIAGIAFLIVSVLMLALRVDLYKKLGEPKRAFASVLLTQDKVASVTRQLIALASEAVAAEKALVIDATKPLLDVVGELANLWQAYPGLRTSEHYGTLLAQVRQLADEMHRQAENYNAAATRFNEDRAPFVSRLLGVADLPLLTDCSDGEIRSVKRRLGM